jgi:hypothetical protein
MSESRIVNDGAAEWRQESPRPFIHPAESSAENHQQIVAEQEAATE